MATYGHEGGYAFNEDQRGGHHPSPVVVPVSQPWEGPKTHDEAQAVHHGFLNGITAYAVAKGESGLKSENETLRKLADDHGFKTIEDLERLAAKERAAETLASIKATLLVNFGDGSKHNRYGFSIADELDVHHMMYVVLTELTKRRIADSEQAT